jgi:predicted GIY-YIG superfamily endonuclease
MEDFEETALKSSLFKPKCWLRYVDDVFAIWSHGEVKLYEFLDHINSIHPKIQFTMEMEENGKLPFLDVLLMKTPNDSIGHTVYRKPTHTNRYLHADSHHFPGQKKGVLNTLITRSRRLTDKEHISEELRLLREVFINNGYSKREIKMAFAKNSAKNANVDTTKTKKDEFKSIAVLPYVSGTTDAISRILKRHSVITVFVPLKKLHNLIRPVKDVIPQEKCGVYKVPCTCGSCYIGQTQKQLKNRLKEHRYHELRGNISKSAVAAHAHTDSALGEKHTILYDEAIIIDTEKKGWPRFISEGLQIIKHPHNFNGEDCGYILSKSWSTAINLIEKAKKPPSRNVQVGLPQMSTNGKASVTQMPLHKYSLRSTVA